MQLASRFPDRDLVITPLPELTPEWSNLLTIGAQKAGIQIADWVGLSMSSKIRLELALAEEICVLVPKRKKHRKDRRFWELSLLLQSGKAIVADMPMSEYFEGDCTICPDYLRTVKKLGSFRFTENSGRVLWPHVLHETSRTKFQNLHEIILPFYDYETGDYDCWKDGNASDTWFYDHENSVLSLYCSGGFTAWFEKKFRRFHMKVDEIENSA